jgi:hypothetical protein
MARPHTRVHSEAGRSTSQCETLRKGKKYSRRAELNSRSMVRLRYCASQEEHDRYASCASAGCASNEACRVPEKSGTGSGDPGGVMSYACYAAVLKGGRELLAHPDHRCPGSRLPRAATQLRPRRVLPRSVGERPAWARHRCGDPGALRSLAAQRCHPSRELGQSGASWHRRHRTSRNRQPTTWRSRVLSESGSRLTLVFQCR